MTEWQWETHSLAGHYIFHILTAFGYIFHSVGTPLYARKLVLNINVWKSGTEMTNFSAEFMHKWLKKVSVTVSRENHKNPLWTFSVFYHSLCKNSALRNNDNWSRESKPKSYVALNLCIIICGEEGCSVGTAVDCTITSSDNKY